MTEEYIPPLGPRFSQLYVERGPVQQDSKRLRNRISAYFESEMSKYAGVVGAAIRMRIGTDHYFSGYAHEVGDYLEKCKAYDFYDAITVIHSAIRIEFERNHYTSDQVAMSAWRKFCSAAFLEENVGYQIDDECIVRPLVDDEFARTTTALLRGLQDSRLAAVRSEVDRAIDDLGGKNPDYKGAVKSTFEALEIYAKLSVRSCEVRRLNRNIVMEHIVPAIQKQSGYDGPAGESAGHMGQAIVDWLAACHIYRHGQGVNEPAPPPADLAIALISAGLAYLRWFLDNLPIAVQNNGR